MSRQVFVLAHREARRRAVDAVRFAPEGYVVRVSPPTRSLEQNALLWSRLNDLAKQVVWHGRTLSADDWKIVMTASLRQMVVVPNIEGTGFVALGNSTSRMTRREMTELIELIEAFGAREKVRWTLNTKQLEEA